VSTGETSYTSIVQRALQPINPSVANQDTMHGFIDDALGMIIQIACQMETKIEMTGERTTADIPVTKMTADDCRLFDELCQVPRRLC
jgi:hypothetical protein